MQNAESAGPQGAVDTTLPEGGGSAEGAQNSPGSSLPPDHPLAPLDLAHQQAKAVMGKVSSAQSMVKSIRTELDKLVALGSAISDEDVLQGMAKLVAGGADPKAFLALMAGDPASGSPPMPTSGEALAGWVAQQDQMMRAQEAHVEQGAQLAQHQLGVSALRVLAGHHVLGKFAEGRGGGAEGAGSAPPNAPPPAPQSPGSNPLTQ